MTDKDDINKSRSEKMMGNKNSIKNKMFYDRIKMELVQNPHKLQKIVEKLLSKAEEGDLAAINVVMDRIDGKAIQTTELTGADGEPLTGIQVTFVKPNE